MTDHFVVEASVDMTHDEAMAYVRRWAANDTVDAAKIIKALRLTGEYFGAPLASPGHEAVAAMQQAGFCDKHHEEYMDALITEQERLEIISQSRYCNDCCIRKLTAALRAAPPAGPEATPVSGAWVSDAVRSLVTASLDAVKRANNEYEPGREGTDAYFKAIHAILNIVAISSWHRGHKSAPPAGGEPSAPGAADTAAWHEDKVAGALLNRICDTMQTALEHAARRGKSDDPALAGYALESVQLVWKLCERVTAIGNRQTMADGSQSTQGEDTRRLDWMAEQASKRGPVESYNVESPPIVAAIAYDSTRTLREAIDAARSAPTTRIAE